MKLPVGAGRSGEQPCADCAVRPFTICAALDEAELHQMEHLSRRLHFSPNEAVFSQEELAASVYHLLEGVMRLYKLLPDGRRQIVGFALPGDFLETAGDRYGFSADAVGQVVVCRFSRSSFARFVEQRPKVLLRLNAVVASELGQAREQMVSLGRRSAAEKVASFLIGWRGRLARLAPAPTSVPLPMGRQDIADYLGLTVETVSRTLTRLERDGVLEIVSGGVRLLDPARVEAMSVA
jgi:CRP/FNR family transcriptional regulator